MKKIREHREYCLTRAIQIDSLVPMVTQKISDWSGNDRKRRQLLYTGTG